MSDRTQTVSMSCALAATALLVGARPLEAASPRPRAPLGVAPVFVHEAQLFGHGDPVGVYGEFAGNSVAISGNTAVVGARGGEAVHVFVRSGSTWLEQQKLVASDGVPGMGFGQSVAMSGDTLVVGVGNFAWGDGIGGFAYVFVRSGATWTEQQKLLPPPGLSDDSFGYSVAVSGDTVVVGEPGDSDLATGFLTGSAHVFVRSGTTWTPQQRLNALDAKALAQFGFSVGIEGDNVVVGAARDDTAAGNDAGSAYVFVRSGGTWSQQQKLNPADAAPGDAFGMAVSISGDSVAVGAPWDDDATEVSGSAYVFVRSGTTWTEQQKLEVSDAPFGWLGASLSLFQDTLVVGALHDPSMLADAGSAYVFVRSGVTWSQQQKITAPDAAASDLFATSVGISGDALLAGAPGHDAPVGALRSRAEPFPIPPLDTGSAYAFVRTGTTWSLQQEILSLDAPSGGFGRAVISGDTIVVGAPGDNGLAGMAAGSAYVFVRSGIDWSEQQKLTASDAEPMAAFGSSVSVSGDTLIVGASGAGAASNAGAAYVFVRSGAAWTQQARLVPSDPAPGKFFGSSVWIAGDTAVVGAQFDSVSANYAGSAYVFSRSGTTWTQQQKLQGTDTAAGDLFGSSIWGSGDTLSIGSPLHDHGAPIGTDAGAAYVFVRSGNVWTQQQEILASNGAQGDQFGGAVSLSGDTLAVGAPFRATAGPAAGSAYVFVRSGVTWALQQQLTASDAAQGDVFGDAVSLQGDLLAVGAYADDGYEGATYLFARSGVTWTEQPKLLAPQPTAHDQFGLSESLDGTLAVGSAESVHVFHGLTVVDVAVTKTDGQASAVPGQPLTYSMTVSSAGPDPGLATHVVDTPPAALGNVTWTCAPSPGSSCPAAGSGAIDHVANIAVGSLLTYSLTGTVSPGATGSLANSLSAAPPVGVADPSPANNTATDTDTLTPVADLSVTKTDGQAAAVPGQHLTYTVAVANTGPSDAAGATLADVVPADLVGVHWSCAATSGASCTASGSGSINDTVSVPAGGLVAYSLSATVDPAAIGTLANTATITPSAGATDPDLANNSATDSDVLASLGFVAEGELVHGYDRQHDLAALPGPIADEDLFRIRQSRRASYEVLLDGTSGDLGSPDLDLLGSDGASVVVASSPAGPGGSRSLRWMNSSDQPVADQFVRVRSAGCTTGCDAADVYRLRMRETTGFIPRFNNSGSQVTVLILENAGGEAVDLDVRFWGASGAPVGGVLTTVPPRGTYVLNTVGIVPGAGGTITVANTGRYGQVTGKAVALEPATGFTFDTGLELRRR